MCYYSLPNPAVGKPEGAQYRKYRVGRCDDAVHGEVVVGGGGRRCPGQGEERGGLGNLGRRVDILTNIPGKIRLGYVLEVVFI